jgi:hypothetical protein
MQTEGNDNEPRHDSNKHIARKEKELAGTMRKSDDITRTPTRGQALAITPSKKKTSKREQGSAKKSRQGRKKGLLEFFVDGPQVKAPATDGTPIKTAKNQTERTPSSINTTKIRDSDKSTEDIRRKKSRSDNEESEVQVDLEQISKTPLKAKGTTNSVKKTKKKTGKASTPDTRGKKKATFAETVGKDTVKEKEIDYKTCVVGFAVRVDKGKDTKGGFDKTIIKGLNFMQTYIDQNASFRAIRPGTTAKPIKGKLDMPKYQVTMQNYFCIPNPRAFNKVNAKGGRVIKGSAIMGFTDNPQQCLDNAAGDLRMMGCTIFYKKCQEVDTVTSQILIGAPNTIQEDIIKQTMNEDLKKIESTLLLSDKNYKLTREQSKNWIRYSVVKDFPARMPWEGLEEKKQKQGTNNACLA